MTAAERASLRIAAVFCGALGLCSTIYVILILSRGLVIAPLSDVLFPGFLVFYAAARAFFAGKLALVYDIDAFTQYQNALLADRFPRPLHFRPFFYPPTWLLMLLPFGLLGVASAYSAFMSLTAAAATALVGRRDWWGWLAVVTSPAAVWVVLAGQNTFFSIALFYGGFRLLDRTPAVAGILFGLLSYKPQIWVLVPLALFAARQWRGLGWAIGTAFALSLASIAMFGFDVWLAFRRYRASSGLAAPGGRNVRAYLHAYDDAAGRRQDRRLARAIGERAPSRRSDPGDCRRVVRLSSSRLERRTRRRPGGGDIPDFALCVELRPPAADAGGCRSVPTGPGARLPSRRTADLCHAVGDPDLMHHPESNRPAGHTAGRSGFRRSCLDATEGPTQSRIAERGTGGLKPMQFAAKSMREEVHGR
jgi:hypothetical protein